MNIVLLSGGSGKRLWPLSNDARSKQFLKVLRAKKGKHESMLQRVYGQIKQAILNPVITIVTSSIQSDSIHQQTDEDINLVFEPERRNTFAAILLACADLYYNKNVDRDDVIIVAPIDPYAETSFFAQFNALEKATQDNAGDLVLMGVSPTYPAAKYGYIVPEKSIMENMDSQRVACFKEKPSEMEAEALISQGALWNCGIFAFKLGYVLDILRQHMQVSTYAQVVEGYANLPKNSFDYEVVERASSVAVVKYEGAWKDLGTWNTLAEELSEENSGIVLRDDTTINTHIINEMPIPVMVLGARDMVVIATYDGILVSDKHQSSYMKPLVDQVHQRPMYERKRWGEYRVMDSLQYENGTQVLTKRLSINAGKALSYQVHKHRKEVWTIIKGKGTMLIDGKEFAVKTGDVIEIPIGTRHALFALSELEFIEVQIGSPLVEEDIERLEENWHSMY